MSRHRLYQNYDYEDELSDYDGQGNQEEEEEDLSPEDKKQMAEATAEVINVLGPQSDKVTTQQVQEALWHYYYDVDKSVAYLVNKFIDPPKKTTKPKLKTTTPSSDGEPLSRLSLLTCPFPSVPTGASEAEPESTTCSDFFADMPWLRIPEDRRTVFISPPRPRGGLLGGSSSQPKMSKLQALAAARKRKAEEATLPIRPQETSQRGSSQKEAPRKATLAPQASTISAPNFQAQAVSTQSTPLTGSHIDGTSDDATTHMAAPSAFAQTLFKSASEAPGPTIRDLYYPPWMAYTSPEALKKAFEKPSPDDVVLTAQSQAADSPAAGKKAAKQINKAAEAAQDLNKLKVSEAAPLPKSKNLNVLKEYASSRQKKELSFVVVGHVDSGKSTMLGRLLLDMNVVDQRTIDKYKKEAEKTGKSSFALAWVLDSRTEERARGVTMDIATNHFETDATLLTLIDAPGHRDFIPNMLAGTSLADFAVLVVDAAKGAFEAGLKGQTREHALLLRSMGIFRIIVAVNKLDTAEWDSERFEEIRDQILGSLKALKFPIKDISFVPVSGLKGDNIVRRSTDPAATWYSGPTLLEELERSEPMTGPEDLTRSLRMMITDIWESPQSPVTVSGRIEAGFVQVGDAVLVQPSGEKAYIKTIERSGGEEPVDWAVAGQQVILYLSHIEEINVHLGDVLCSMSDPIPCVNVFTMRALAFDTFFPMPVDLHRGRLAAPAFVRELTATLDIQKGSIIKRKPQIVKAGAVGRIKVRVEEGAKLPLEKGQRVILRSEGNTVAAGLIE
ncbi:hypothetical protein M406DRAFT_342209 [Cryphonectria parasitica EP155]|uniref:Elongation factor 1 alpha-like protein n=1 Tax=Cryphonectria parasitica (strain ATCC 38755 / EP155) TaxID=660469 RepID=A0A9P4XU97_CRYP1|nr:uncharacterized protein M406DRAFT_342209 [Cryphonectria parasitica EP155]KAF3761409.1 hypothetical protein M406DRAFT_342209 [Cryphonectria parasitica EP155]